MREPAKPSANVSPNLFAMLLSPRSFVMMLLPNDALHNSSSIYPIMLLNLHRVTKVSNIHFLIPLSMYNYKSTDTTQTSMGDFIFGFA